jgi:hypothetical protein
MDRFDRGAAFEHYAFGVLVILPMEPIVLVLVPVMFFLAIVKPF